MSLKRILVSILACAGLGAGISSRVAAQQNDARQIAVTNGQKNSKILEADSVGGFGGSLSAMLRRPSHTPYEWGTSRACAQMRRKNSMRAMGIAGSRI
ncbi:MAG: hypothetical protein ABIO94_11935 [Opitutaceae bacterium]